MPEETLTNAPPSPSLITAETAKPTTETPAFVPDPAKSVEENEAAKLAHEAPKPPEAPKPEPVIPLTVDGIKIPEGSEANAESLTKFTEILNDSKLSPGDRANALVSLQAEITKAASEGASKAWDDFNTAQQDEVRKDPEIGGAKLEATLGAIGTLLNTHGSPELRTVFDNSGAGNNIHVVKFLSKIAGLVGEGKPLAAPAPAKSQDDVATRMFPSMTKGT